MGTRVLIAIAVLVLGALGACERTSLHYCEKNPTDYSHCPAPDGALVQCTGNADCPKNLPVCNVSLGLCVECLADTDCKDAMHPRCDVDHSQCVECTSGSDCASGTCLFGGVCQTVDNTAYVDSTTGVDNADCTMAMPCLTVAVGIGVGKPFVHLHGNFSEKGGIAIADSVNVTLIGDDGTTYRRTDKGPVIAIGMGGTVGIQNLDISSALPTMCIGIQTKAGTFTFSQLTVHDCQAGPGGGILVGGGKVAIAQSKIYGNLYGISLAGATHFDITNNFIVHNGNTAINQAASGAMLGMGTMTDRFEFNTVSDNTVKMMGPNVGGVACPMGFAAPDNILSGNLIGTTPPTALTQSAGCIVTGSLSSATDAGLNFANTTTSPYDYHIAPGSSAIDGATSDPNITIDYDDQVRPHGNGYDFGADEL